jgi:CDP-diacylglycerol--glycerol-3-phosphate 3-phosphatidyltransferase
MELDTLSTLILLGLVGLVTLFYIARVTLKGRAHFDRVERQGASALLGKPMMEMAHWSVEPVAKAFCSLGITPNQISWASLVFGFFAGCALAYGHFGYGAILSVVASFLDLLDGMVARKTGKSSDAGEVLDASIDRYVEFFFLGGLIIYYHQVCSLLVLTLAALMGSYMVSYSTAKAEALDVEPPPGSMRRPERATYLILGAVVSNFTLDFEPRYFSGLRAGLPMVFALVLVASVSNISAVLRLRATARAIRARA